MNGITIYDDEDFFELLDSVRATAKAHQGTFTADEMLNALKSAVDTGKDGNEMINSNRVQVTLGTLTTHVGRYELKETEGLYEYNR